MKEMLVMEALRRGLLGGRETIGSKLEDETFPQQKAFIVDESKRSTLKTPRRAAKTESIIRKMFRVMKRKPGSISVYVSMTRENAKRNVWSRLQIMAARYKLEVLFNHSDLTIRDPVNNSMIWITGLATAAEIAKLRGNKYDLVVVDESQDILIDFEDFIMSVLIPALGDRRGQLVLAGTPDPWRRNKYWHDVRNSKDGKWKRWVHFGWLLTDNVYFQDPAGYLAQVLEEEGYAADDPRYRAEYLGEDAISTSNLAVDSYSQDRNAYPGSVFDVFSNCHGYHYLMAANPRFKANSAFVVACYSSRRRHVIFLESLSGLVGVSELADATKQLMDKYPIEIVTCIETDMGRDFAAELLARYQLPITPFEKRDERMRLAFLNSDLRTGRLQVVADENAKLIDQWANVLWDKDRQKILSGQDCDLFNAAGYAHMACRSFFEEEPVVHVDEGDAYWLKQAEQMRGNVGEP